MGKVQQGGVLGTAGGVRGGGTVRDTTRREVGTESVAVTRGERPCEMENPPTGIQDAGTGGEYHMTRGDMGSNATDGKEGCGYSTVGTARGDETAGRGGGGREDGDGAAGETERDQKGR